MRLRLAACLVGAWAASGAVFGQSVTVDLPAGATQRLEISGPARLTYSGSMVVVNFGNNPIPPIPPVPPNPDPEPPAPPNPDPVPGPGKVYATMIYDPATETAEQAAVRADLATGSALPGIGVAFRAYSTKDPKIDERNLRSAYVAANLPVVVLQRQVQGSSTAPVVKTVDKVASAAAVVEAVKKVAAP